MTLPSYIINWDELLSQLENPDFNVGGGTFPELADLLKKIIDTLAWDRKQLEGCRQRIKGFHTYTDGEEHIIEWTPEKKSLLTGIAFSHSHVEGIDDFFNMSLVGSEAELIFQQIYFKDGLQHKYFNKFFPVDAGATLKIVHKNPSLKNKHIWYDIEYLEHTGEADMSWENPPWWTELPLSDPDIPSEPSAALLDYFCSGSVSPGTINTSYFTWNELTTQYVATKSKNLLGAFWEDRNTLLELLSEFMSDSNNVITVNKITASDFHKFLFKAMKESRAGALTISQSWQEFKAWCDTNLPCLTDFQKAGVFYTVKSKIITNLFASAEGFVEGKVPDVISGYLARLPHKTVDWIDYNDVKREPAGSTGITGAYAVDLFASDYPDLLDGFSSYVNMEPQCLLFSEQGLRASNPSDYVNEEGNFWGANVPASIVDWTSHITSEYSGGDAETKKGLVATETAVHELGHCVDYYFTKSLGKLLTDLPEWISIGGWIADSSMDSGFKYLIKNKPANLTGGMPKTSTGHEAPVSDYGCSQPAEDFAEAFAVYIVNPSFLQTKYPQRFSFMETYVKPLI